MSWWAKNIVEKIKINDQLALTIILRLQRAEIRELSC